MPVLFLRLLSISLVVVLVQIQEGFGAGTILSPAAEATGERLSERPGSDRANLLLNPSFEDGRSYWWSFAGPERGNWADFSVVQDVAHAGKKSALLELTSSDYAGETRIYGAIQELTPAELPRRLAGWYRIEDWQRGASDQYLQVVVVVWNASNIRGGRGNVQVSLVLTGITEPPFNLRNRGFEFVGEREPRLGKWIYFELDLHNAFTVAYGAVPENFSRMSVLFEVRFDGRNEQTDNEARAKVYYDDLYLGF